MIIIAHRLNTVIDSDRILVMAHGTCVEYDYPYKLLVENEGDVNISKFDGLFVDMVKATGEKTAKELFEIARAKFYQGK